MKKAKLTNDAKENLKFSKKVEEERKKLSEMSETEQFTIIKEKILKASNGEVNEKKFFQIAHGLASEKGVQQAYLNKNFQTTLDYFSTIPKSEKEKTFVSGVIQSEVPISGSNEQQEEELVIEQEDMENLIKTNEKLKIKLVITEIAKSEKEKSLRKLLSPVASTLNIGPKCGKILFLNKRNVSFSTFCWSLVFRMDK
jgi:hypothetical protein